MLDKVYKKRHFIVIAFTFIIFLLFSINLFNIQIVNAKQIRESAVEVIKQDVQAPRGEILDRNGNKLVVNKQVNTIIFDYISFPTKNEERNKIIVSLINLFKETQSEWVDNLPIILNENGELVFDEEKENEVSYLKSSVFLDLNYYASVQDCFNALVQRYGLEQYDKSTARSIASVYYSMVKDGFNKSTPYTFADDVNEELVSQIKENSEVYTGVDVKIVSEREYVYPDLATHTIGLVGKISQYEYEQKKDSGYLLNDFVGKSGVEYTFEEELRGENGIKTITKDSSGNITEEYEVEPVPGNSIVLTIDKDMQMVAQDSLAKTVENLQENRDFLMSGAVVVMDVKNNDTLAIASYPNYNFDEYMEDPEKINDDPAKPLWNRALKSTFTPGSTIKPIVALGGLEEGLIDADTEIKCTGIYTHYYDYQPGCTGVHGDQNVIEAIFHSCNIFFYETSRLLGIEKMNSYFKMFGLGEKTGIELGEDAGVVDSVDYRESRGQSWTPGLTIQSGIGYGDNGVTPIQLCSYVSTLANEGVRYKSSIIKSIKTYDYSKTVFESAPEILSTVEFSDENWDLVKAGMLKVGTESYVDFSKVPVQVGAKTGTTTIEKLIDGKIVDTYNGFIIAFAPFDDPEIAIAVAVEGAGSGGSVAPVANDILKYYFEKEEDTETVQNEGVLLK